MATYSTTCTLDNATPSDAYLQSFMTAFYDCLEIGPVTQTSDTGQFDPTTVLWSSLNTTVGSTYRVHYLNDSLHSTRPIYIRSGWHIGSTSYLRNTVTIGTGSDGAGNITGLRFTYTNTGTQTAYAPATVTMAGTAGEGYCGVFSDCDRTNSSTAYSFAVFRTTDDNEDLTEEGALFYMYKVGSTGPMGLMAALDFAHTTYVDASQYFSFFPNSYVSALNFRNTSWDDENRDYAVVQYPLMNKLAKTPFMVSGWRSEWLAFTEELTATPISAEHTYRPVRSNYNCGIADYSTDPTLTVPLIVWE